MSEKLAFNEFRGYGSAVDLDKWAAASWTEFVQLSGNEFFTRAVLSRDEHSSIGGCHLPNHVFHLKHGLRLANHLTLNLYGFLQHLVFGGQVLLVQGIAQSDE